VIALCSLAGCDAEPAAPDGPSSARAGVTAAPAVRVGLERLDAPEAQTLKGLRVGLIVNRASVTRAGTPSVDALRAHGVKVRRLFTPEHGLDGTAGAGVAQANGRDPRTGLAVVSLYGGHTAPTARDLAGLDALVFDLQDVGVRFFTYVSTELLALRAAGAAGLPFYVLDRPNPLGGTLVAGPVAAGRRSFLSVAPGPLVHGLTAGEMARYVNARSARPARLTVVAMTGWRRSLRWADTGRRWIPPSPNLRSPDAALLYPGTALFEATNVSEGRGTPSPFTTICAPWLDVAATLRAARRPDVRLSARTVVPRSSDAAPAPKYAGVRCPGVHAAPVRATVDGFRVGLALLHAVRRDPRFAWLGGGASLDTLAGTPRPRRALDRGASVAAIVASEAPAVRDWERARASALLYP